MRDAADGKGSFWPNARKPRPAWARRRNDQQSVFRAVAYA
jgi:hypothetical protein